MTIKKLIATLSLVSVVAAVLGLGPVTIQAAPLAQTNLLQNPGMEEPYNNCGGQKGYSPNGWDCWNQLIDKPANDASGLQYAFRPYFSAETNPSGKYRQLIHGGSVSLHVGHQQDPWIGGLKQSVTVPANAQLRFCAWSQLYANNTDFGKGEPSVGSYEGRSRVGIFPNGDADWNTPGIAWSGAINPHDNWSQVCVTTTAGPQGKVTLFTSNDYRGYAANHLDAWWDDAELVVVGDAPTAQPTAGAAQPQPTAPAQPQPTAVPAAPNPDGSIVHTIVAGDTLFGLSFQYNVSLDDILALNGLTKDSILSIGQKVIIKGAGGSTAAQPTAAAQPTGAAAPGTTPPAPDQTAQPASTQPTAQPTQPANTAAKLCVRAYNDANNDGLYTAGEDPIAGVQFAVANSQGVQSASFTTDDTGDEHCFTDLQPGSYTVAVQPATGTVATSDKRWGVALTGGSVVNINFGSRSDGSVPAQAASGQPDTTSSTNSNGGSGLGGLLTGAIGLIVLLVAGVLGAFVIARRRA